MQGSGRARASEKMHRGTKNVDAVSGDRICATREDEQQAQAGGVSREREKDVQVGHAVGWMG
eukprot:1087963-Pleurochrysis_carterae.AAC.1